MIPAKVWFRRTAWMYAAGTWTVFGFFGLHALRNMSKDEKNEEEEQQQHLLSKEEGSPTTISEDGLTETTVYRSPGQSFYVSAVTTYKPNFIPYTTRLYYYLQSFFDDRAKKEK